MLNIRLMLFNVAIINNVKLATLFSLLKNNMILRNHINLVLVETILRYLQFKRIAIKRSLGYFYRFGWTSF